MNPLRSWSRRAYVLHGYLIAMLALLPVPPSRLAWAEEEDPPPEPPPEEEVWSYNHSESMDSVTLGSSGAAPEGGEVTLQALVETTSWEVWTSSFGNVRTENYVTQPNTSTWVSWSVASGGGHLASASNWTDSFGLAEATFVMSGGPSEVRAGVVYQSSSGGAEPSGATLWLEPTAAPGLTWNLSEYRSSLYAVQLLPVEGGAGGLVPGEPRTLVAEVQESSWEVWTNGNGDTEPRNTTYAPAVNAPVTFYIQSGDGTVDASNSVTVMTDGQGRAQATFVMGGSTTVAAAAAGEGLIEGGGVEFTPGTAEESWSFSHTEDTFALSLETPGGVTELLAGQGHGLLARAEVTTWQVFTSNYGNMDYREPYTQPAAWLPLYLWVMEGDGMLVDPPVTAGEDGTAEVNLQMGTGSTRVQALLPDGNLFGGCSTSGWGYKIPGRVGDSPIIGSGLYVDNEVGAAGATGIGENVMRYCGSFLVVEYMRQGLHPQEACIETIRRIARMDPKGFDLAINFIAIDRKGRFGAAGTGTGFQYAATSSAFSKVLQSPGLTAADIGPIGGNRK